MKITKKELKQLIKEELLKEGGVKNIVYYKPQTLSVKVPAFTFKAKIKLDDYELWDGRTVKQPVNIEIDTFDNNIEKTLDNIITKAVVDAVNKQFKEINFKVSEKNSRVGGYLSSFPKIFGVNKK